MEFEWKGNNKCSVSCLVEGEPVKIIEGEEMSSFIYLGDPYIEYFKSKFIKCQTRNTIFKANKINLN